jgi:hypothetical protein
MAISSLSLLMVKPVYSQSIPTMLPYPTPETYKFTYVLPNYVVNYSIVKMEPPDAQTPNPYAYNIVVYGPPPFPIQISFNETTYYGAPSNMTVINTTIMPTYSIATSIGSFNYPTNITMMELSNESVSPRPTFSTPSLPEFPILAILPLFLSVFLIATKFLRRKCNWHE